MAWVTDDSGEPQVWVARYPSFDEPRFVADGDFPKWRPDGGELYFVSDGLLMAREVAGNESALELGAREEVLNLARLGAVWNNLRPPYAPSGDGQRFLVHVRSDQAEAPPVKVIVNWTRLIEDE